MSQDSWYVFVLIEIYTVEFKVKSIKKKIKNILSVKITN